MISLNRKESAAARHHTYLLLSRLLLDGLTDDLRPYIALIPELADVSPQPFIADEAAAAHYRIFAHDIFPYESIFRDPSRLLGGVYAARVQTTYEQNNAQITSDYDHIGQELAFLSAMNSREYRALNSKDRGAADEYEDIQRSFLQDHLLCWLPPLVTALAYSDQPFYAALGELTRNLVFDHMHSVGRSGSTNESCDLDCDDFPLLPDLLEKDETGLKQVATFLITPPHCGLYLGRDTIAALAREQELPRGFGDRQQMLSNLFHTAAQYDLMPDLLQKLESLAQSYGQKYEEQLTLFPEMSTWIQPWRQRAIGTARALADMKRLSITTI